MFKDNLDEPVLALFVRFVPKEWSSWPCMRVEVYGKPASKSRDTYDTRSDREFKISPRNIKRDVPVVTIGDFNLSTSTISSTRTTFQFYFAGFTLSNHIPISSRELPFLPKTNTTSMGSGNVTGLKFENRTRLILVVQSKGP